MKEIGLRPHVLSDEIVAEGIKGINSVRLITGVNGLITGGMGVQSYLPSDAYRKTVDLDFNLFWGGGTNEFRDVTEPFVEYLNAQGYEVAFKKKGTTLEYVVSSEGDSLLVQHKRRSANSFKKNKHSLDREMANKRIVNKEGVFYPVLSPEDLVLRKLGRISIFSEKYMIGVPFGFTIGDLKLESEAIRKDVLQREGDVSPREVARLRLFYDCLDIKNLAHYAGLNKNYFGESMKDYDSQGRRDDFERVLDSLDIVLE